MYPSWIKGDYYILKTVFILASMSGFVLFLCGIPLFNSSDSLQCITNQTHPSGPCWRHATSPKLPFLHTVFCLRSLVALYPTIALKWLYIIHCSATNVFTKCLSVWCLPGALLGTEKTLWRQTNAHIAFISSNAFSSPSCSSSPLVTPLTRILHCLTLSHSSVMLCLFCFFKLFS